MKKITPYILIGILVFCSVGCVAAPQLADSGPPKVAEDAALDSAANDQPAFEGFKDLSLDERTLFTTNEWIELSEQDIFDHTDFIFEGAITNAAEYIAVGPQLNSEYYFTVLTVVVDKVYYQSDPSSAPPETFGLKYPITSIDADYSPECPKAGDRAVFFATKTQDFYGIPIPDIAPFCIRDFNRTDIRIENGSYLVDGVFISLNDLSVNPMNTSMYAPPTLLDESTFEEKLSGAIQKYKEID